MGTKSSKSSAAAGAKQQPSGSPSSFGPASDSKAGASAHAQSFRRYQVGNDGSANHNDGGGGGGGGDSSGSGPKPRGEYANIGDFKRDYSRPGGGARRRRKQEAEAAPQMDPELAGLRETLKKSASSRRTGTRIYIGKVAQLPGTLYKGADPASPATVGSPQSTSKSSPAGGSPHHSKQSLHNSHGSNSSSSSSSSSSSRNKIKANSRSSNSSSTGAGGGVAASAGGGSGGAGAGFGLGSMHLDISAATGTSHRRNLADAQQPPAPP